MIPILEHVVRTDRHRTFYLSAGAEDATPIVFVHGWPELSISWRHQLPCFAGLGFRAVAPDMRGYRRSSVYARREDHPLAAITPHMMGLLGARGRGRGMWVGHDWGGPVVWSVASHHPDRCLGVASLCVPYFARGFTPEVLVPLVDRSIYPEADFPAGQWEYQLFYEEHFDRARSAFEANVANTVKALFRKGSPKGEGKPSRTAFARREGGWFGGAGQAPRPAGGSGRAERRGLSPVRRRPRGQRLHRTRLLVPERPGQHGIRGAGGGRRRPVDAGAVPPRPLRLRLRDGRLAPGRADAPRLPRPDRGGGGVRALDGPGEAGGGQRRPRPVAGRPIPGAVGGLTRLARPGRRLG